MPNYFVARTYPSTSLTETRDDRQTLYWNPYLVTTESGALSLSFFSNDSGGPVVVEIRGTTVTGEPIQGTFLLNKK